MRAMKRICVVVSSEMTIKAFLVDQLRALSSQHQVSVVANAKDDTFLAGLGIAAEAIPIAIIRKIAVLRDLKALWFLWRLFRAHRFDAVHSVTPKAGLLAMVAAAMAGVPNRTHMFTGQVWATRTGAFRHMLKSIDWLIARLATRVLADSQSQREFLIDEGVVSRERISVLGAGSISGVDLSRFKPDSEARDSVRSELHLPKSSLVLLYVGRLNKDKGVLDLAEAFMAVSRRFPSLYLLLVGQDEEAMVPRFKAICAPCLNQLRFVAFTPAPERYMAASDALCLPSYREGFGSVIIEAAAAGLPAMASRIYGITDAVVDGETGILYEPRNPIQIAQVIERLASEPRLMKAMAESARYRARTMFAKEALTSAMVEFYANLLTPRKAARHPAQI